MSFTQTVAKLDESRNLNTSPWTVSGLKGDQFDYGILIFCDSGTGTTGDLHIRPNGDSANNCEIHEMYGQGTAKSLTNDATMDGFKAVGFTDNDGSRNSFLIASITGDSSQDRIFKALASNGVPRISNLFNRWNNNVDELTSLEFYSSTSGIYKWRIIVFEIPKLENNDNWELIKELSWDGTDEEQTVVGLNGDTDIQYLLRGGGDTENFNVQVNGDATSNVILQRAYSDPAGFRASRNTAQSGFNIKTDGSIILNAETGASRTALGFHGPAGATPMEMRAEWYSNSVTEITSLEITPYLTGVNTMQVFRRKNPKSSIMDLFGLPFEKIQEINVDSADFTTGESFTGLEGDKVLCYRLEFNGVQSDIIQIRTNGDAGVSDYAWQRLYASGTVENAGSDGADSSIEFLNDSNGQMSHSVFYIYPQSGEYRPMLGYYMAGTNALFLRAGWRLDSVTEVTSLLVKTAGGSGTITGKFTLSAIYK